MLWLVLFVVLLVSPYATFCCARNDQLVFPIRLLVTTENVCRFLFAFANFGIILCNADYKIFNAKCSSTISSFFDFLHANFQFLELCTQYCQVGVSIKENGKVSRAERLLMIQMLCNSGAQFLDTITWKFFLIFVTLFFGYNMQRLFVFSVYLMSFLLMDLGGCIVCILFLRKVSPTPSQSRRSTISNHHRPSL
ncbi:unnamed protein product, partial [Mesorhabditis belari]|uniref:Uncharacterized protein n=1 Tax=Mesorhabditis belari TaxID=2138241 RepID=A0AAF3EEL6_9BILA